MHSFSHAADSQRSQTMTGAHVPPPPSLDALDFGDAGEDTVVAPVAQMPRLKWLNGALTEHQTEAVGWHIEYGSDPQLDETLAMLEMPRVVVEQHTSGPDGSRSKLYWQLHFCSLIVIAEGVLSPFQLRRDERRTGMAYGLETMHNDQGEPLRYDHGTGNLIKRRVLKVRAFVHELVRHGYHEWLALTLYNTTADGLLEALSSQMRVLATYKQQTGRGAPFYGFSLPLVPGPQTPVKPPRGATPRTGPGSHIYPIRAAVPEHLDATYLLAHAIPASLVQQIREHALPDALEWSVLESRRISESEWQSPVSLAEEEPTPSVHTTAPVAPAPVTDPLVGPAQVAWLRQTYCHLDPRLIQMLCAQHEISDLKDLRMSQFRVLRQAQQGHKTSA